MKKWLYILTIFVLSACSTTKNIPQGKYLLDDVSIKSDTKSLDISTLENFFRQSPNGSLPIVGKLGLKIYNLAGDTSKWSNRFIQSLGRAPVIYDQRMAAITAEQICKELKNEGYLNARVDTLSTIKGDKKIGLQYDIHASQPYLIRNYTNNVDDPRIAKILNRKSKLSQVKTGMLFDQAILEKERVNMTNLLRNKGYYKFSKEYLYFKADTTLNSHQVDLFLSLYKPNDSIHRRYKYRNITIKSGFDPLSKDSTNYNHSDTTTFDNIQIVHDKNKFLNNSVLTRNIFLKPGTLYSDNTFSQTISSYNRMGAIKQTNITLKEVSPLSQDSLKYVDATINIVPANVHWFQTALDGTNSAGNLGIAPSISYKHQNFFNSATLFTFKLKGAYEFISGSQSGNFLNKSYYEYGFETSLAFPQFLFPWLSSSLRKLPTASTNISLGLTNQHRPEYTRQFFNASLGYRWTSMKGKLSHYLNILDVNYIRMPWTSENFDQEYLSDPVLRATYSNELIAGTIYTITYANTSENKIYNNKRDAITIRAGIDLSGLLPRLITSFGTVKLDSLGQREILGIAYSEYIKGDLSFAHTHKFNKKNSLAYHIGLGIANPFGNASVLPFEKRYFSGGANSLRGWSTRTLGPGSFQPAGGSDFVNQVGDIQVDLSIESRTKVSKYFELAAFIDGGNIWTIKKYDTQPGGEFAFNKFYKEIALSYGTGVRFDLGFLLLRLDFGMKAYDPARDMKDRWVVFRPQFSRDFAWHFAIGYPF